MKNLILVLSIIIQVFNLSAQKLYNQLTNKEKQLYNEHIIEGQPDVPNQPVFVRNGYVLSYNAKYRIPNWVAYRVVPEYLKTPKREKQFAKFRTDPDIFPNPVKDADYTGTGYARGHMAPYFAMGGDRNFNGIYSCLFGDTESYDDRTIFEANYMSNIAPQDQDAMNGAGGPWYALETVIRNKLVGKKNMELHIVVGNIINNPENYKTLKNKYGYEDIAIPDQFFQVLIFRNENGKFITAAFLFPHVRTKAELPYNNVLDYIVPVDTIEKLTGYDFLNKLNNYKQKETESKTNREIWQSFIED
jgi:endonuclease G